MIKLTRFIYLLYYLKNLDFKLFFRFLSFASKESERSALRLLADDICSVFRFNISLIDYFYFRFFLSSDSERKNWAGTGYMYEYQRMMNPRDKRELLENKIEFNKVFHRLVKRDFFSIQSCSLLNEPIEKFLSCHSGKIVLKNSHGQAGKEVQILESTNFTVEELIIYMKKNKFDLIEEYVIQHPDLMHLSSSGLNTVRIITQESGGDIEIIAARLRISINSQVDNLAAGNAAAPVDIVLGKVTGPGVFSDITRAEIYSHPVTGVMITGFEIPFWDEVIALAKEASLISPENRSVGWDIAVTEKGPLLIEGNHNWCKLLWQLPAKMGLKTELDKFI